MGADGRLVAALTMASPGLYREDRAALLRLGTGGGETGTIIRVPSRGSA